MMNALSEQLEVLDTVFQQRYHSLARYLIDARPYVPSGCEGILDSMKGIARFDLATAERAAEVIEKLEGIPQVNPYSQQVAEMNYLDIRFCARRLLEKLQDELRYCDASLRLFVYGESSYVFMSSTLDGLANQIAVLEAEMAKSGLI